MKAKHLKPVLFKVITTEQTLLLPHILYFNVRLHIFLANKKR